MDFKSAMDIINIINEILSSIEKHIDIIKSIKDKLIKNKHDIIYAWAEIEKNRLEIDRNIKSLLHSAYFVNVDIPIGDFRKIKESSDVINYELTNLTFYGDDIKKRLIQFTIENILDKVRSIYNMDVSHISHLEELLNKESDLISKLIQTASKNPDEYIDNASKNIRESNEYLKKISRILESLLSTRKELIDCEYDEFFQYSERIKFINIDIYDVMDKSQKYYNMAYDNLLRSIG